MLQKTENAGSVGNAVEDWEFDEWRKTGYNSRKKTAQVCEELWYKGKAWRPER